MYDLEKLATMPWKNWQKFFIEDLATIAKQLNLDWQKVKERNSSYNKKLLKHVPNKTKIAAYLRSQVIAKICLKTHLSTHEYQSVAVPH